MVLVDLINEDIKVAMRAKAKEDLDALRAVKSALLLAATDKGSDGSVSEEAGILVLQKLVKQRKEAADSYLSQNRQDLADVEINQAKIIEKYLPAQMSEEEIRNAVSAAIATTGASSMKEMGKVMGVLSKDLAGKADNKLVSQIVKELLG